MSEKSTRKAPDYAVESTAARNRSVFRPKLRRWSSQTAEERYNSSESGLKKEIPVKLLYRLESFRRVWPYLRHPNRSWAIAFAWLEEAPIRICWSIALTLMVGTLIFAGAFSSGAMLASVQIQPNAVLPNGESKNLSAHYPLSQPFLYTLENAVPLVKLGMDEKWMPDPKYEHQPWFPQVRWLNGMKWFSSYWFLVASRVLLIFLGWFQAGVLGAVLLRRFKE